jgi:predicted transcriptional regulator
MPQPKLSKLEMQIMQVLWDRGALSIREIQEGFPERDRPAYTTVQTTVYRLEAKNALRRVKKIRTRTFSKRRCRRAEQRRLIDDLLGLFRGAASPLWRTSSRRASSPWTT